MKNFFKTILGGFIKVITGFFTKTLMVAIKTVLKLVTGIINSLFKSLMKVFKVIVDIFMKAVKFIMMIINFIKKFVMNILGKIVEFAMIVFFYITCGLKILGNFHKCIIFYILDVLIWCILFLPLLLIAIFTGLDMKKMSNIMEKLQYLIRWPNGILNDCYRCKNKGGERKFNFLDKLKKAMKTKDTTFNFFFFFLIVMTACFIVFTIYRLVNKK